MEFDERTEKILFIVIVLTGAFLRLYQLDLRPAHFDEGGGYASGILNILHGGKYEYSPDFHGPFLFHITALTFFLFGASDITLRITEAIFGIFLILLLYPIRREFSQISFLAVSAFMALSPSLVYYSRFALHDSYFLFFTFATVVSFILLQKTENRKYAYLTAANLAFLFTAKESAYITAGIFFSYLVLEFLYLCTKNRKKAKQKISGIIHKIISELSFLCNLIFKILLLYPVLKFLYLCIQNRKKAKDKILAILRGMQTIIVSAIVIILFFSIFVLLFTSCFRNFDNLETAITKPVTNWIHRVETGQGYYKPLMFYFDILLQFEIPILIFGIFGIVSSLIVRKPIHRFLAYFAVTSIAVYLYIPYKMSNMVVNITFPLVLASGIFFDVVSEKIIYKEKKKKIRKYPLLFFSLIILVSSLYLLYSSVIANFVNYNNEPENKMVFVQTLDDIKPMLKEIERVSYKTKGNKSIEIDISIPQTEYPLSWYLRDYSNVRFYNEKVNMPDNWLGFNWEGDGVVTWTSFEKKSGEKSMIISSINGSNANFWQKISLEGGREYEFSGWIKTEKLEKVGVVDKISQIHIRSDKGEAPPGIIIAESEPLLGTNNWTEVKMEFSLPEDENAVWVSCVLANWGKAKGEIWFDDLTLNERGTTENLLPNGDFETGNKQERFNAPIIILSENEGQVLENRPGYVMKKYLLRPTVNLAVYFSEDIY